VAPETNGNTEHEDKIAIDIDDEYGDALNTASQEEIIDLAGIYIFFCNLSLINILIDSLSTSNGRLINKCLSFVRLVTYLLNKLIFKYTM